MHLFPPFPVCFGHIRCALTLWCFPVDLVTCFLAPSCFLTHPQCLNRISNTPNLHWFARIPYDSLGPSIITCQRLKGILTTKNPLHGILPKTLHNTYSSNNLGSFETESQTKTIVSFTIKGQLGFLGIITHKYPLYRA